MLTAYRMATLALPLERLRLFMEAPGEKVPQVQYVEPPAAIITTIGAKYPALRKTDPAAYAWFLLGAFLGLRDGQVRAASWSWVEGDGDGKQFWLRIPAEVTKTVHGRSVEIPPAVLAELHALRGCRIGSAAADPLYLVPAAHMTERTESALQRVNRFLRACGLTQDLFSKAFYELRKYYGNDRVWRSKDIYTTARALGHSPEMLEKFYSSSSGRSPIVIPAPVVTPEAIQAATAALAAGASWFSNALKDARA
jgi:integrase